MALIRWEPFREMDSLQREMNRLFESLSSTTQPDNGKPYIPPAEMTETPEEIHLKLEVPGMDAKDIDIQVSAEAIAISGERKSVSRTNGEGQKRSEFRYGAFRRVIPLPARVQNTNVNAEYKDGILHLTLPKHESEKTKVVKVNIG
ncbi:MAG: Hsp20/alpha crystallin family protein [Xenococcaceae cyanobacterium MO_207.B15]|nr:Hsp20/alpha crystallin family protein [Xenococcaceae cyanobacterium MO_207.B15]MDJ0745417.1 Hsp20/alpha crystallin family protein [Xenococcaceae cyanobacterium MO_167.B27]